METKQTFYLISGVIYNLLLHHTNYVLRKCLKIYNHYMLARSSERIFNPMRYAGLISGDTTNVLFD